MTSSMAMLNTEERAYTAVIRAGAKDTEQLQALMIAGSGPGNEDTGRDLHLNRLIPKPWGYEYRVYADDLLDFWQLCLKPGQRTSMHSHPRKVTYLLCLAGQGEMASLDSSMAIGAGDLVKIERGAFHQTSATGDGELHLIEVETPRNKFDLMRLRDDYNRVGMGYETQSVDLHTVFKRVPYLPGAHMCHKSPCKRFEFRVTAGMDLYYRGVTPGAFHVPLGIGPFLHPDLKILHSESTSCEPIRDAYYLTASFGR